MIASWSPHWYVAWRGQRARRRLRADYQAKLATLPAGSRAIVEKHDAALVDAFLRGLPEVERADGGDDHGEIE